MSGLVVMCPELAQWVVVNLDRTDGDTSKPLYMLKPNAPPYIVKAYEDYNKAIARNRE